VVIGATRSLSFTIRNGGSGALLGLGVTLDGADANVFSITASPAAPVSPGDTTTMTVRFAPVAAGDLAARLRLTSNDSARSPFTIELTGTATVSSGAGPFAITATAGSGQFAGPRSASAMRRSQWATSAGREADRRQ
jgi:type 1 fimbria pilin